MPVKQETINKNETLYNELKDKYLYRRWGSDFIKFMQTSMVPETKETAEVTKDKGKKK